MLILGHGFLGRAFTSLSHRHDDVVLFAAGVSDSACEDEHAYQRESIRLDQAIERCRNTGARLVYFSSAGLVYGTYPGRTAEGDAPRPATAHGRHKAGMEAKIGAADVPHLILRLSNVVGPGQPPHQLVPALHRQILAGDVEVWRGAHRDLIHVDDVVRLTEALIATGARGEAFNVASGVAITAERIVDALEEALGVRARRRCVDRPDGYAVSVDKLRQRLGPAALVPFGLSYPERILGRYVAAAGDRSHATGTSDAGP